MQAVIDGIMTSPFTKVKTLEEFQMRAKIWAIDNPELAAVIHTDDKVYNIIQKTAEAVIEKNPTKTGSKLFKERFFTDDIHEIVEPQTSAIQQMVLLGATDETIVATLVAYINSCL